MQLMHERSQDWDNSYDVQERRRMFVGAMAFTTAVGCIFLLIVMLWPRDNIRQNVRSSTSQSEMRASDKNEFAPSPTVAAATTNNTRGTHTAALFGEMSTIAPPKLSLATADLIRRLARLGAERQTLNSMFGPSGALSVGFNSNARSLADLGAVVEGVNDEPAIVANLAGDNGLAASGPLQTYPLSPAALADQQSRAARYRALEPVAPMGAAKIIVGAEIIARTEARPGGQRPRAFDASEGTPLDPLLNKTYDLNFPKVVPHLN
jgi:UPF0755 protein